MGTGGGAARSSHQAHRITVATVSSFPGRSGQPPERLALRSLAPGAARGRALSFGGFCSPAAHSESLIASLPTPVGHFPSLSWGHAFVLRSATLAVALAEAATPRPASALITLAPMVTGDCLPGERLVLFNHARSILITI